METVFWCIRCQKQCSPQQLRSGHLSQTRISAPFRERIPERFGEPSVITGQDSNPGEVQVDTRGIPVPFSMIHFMVVLQEPVFVVSTRRTAISRITFIFVDSCMGFVIFANNFPVHVRIRGQALAMFHRQKFPNYRWSRRMWLRATSLWEVFRFFPWYGNSSQVIFWENHQLGTVACRPVQYKKWLSRTVQSDFQSGFMYLIKTGYPVLQLLSRNPVVPYRIVQSRGR